MVTSINPTVFVPPNSSSLCGGQTEHPILGIRQAKYRKNIILRTAAITEVSAAAITEVSAAADPAQVVATWQIIVGSLAGVTPFVVAGIEFSKRIVTQRTCRVCKGSGLVLRDKKYYFRCPKCGGFLPWQSWKQFFSG